MALKKNGGSILIFSGVRGDTRRYRTLHPYQQMGIAGLNRQLSHLTHPELANQFQSAAIVILHRVPINSQIESLITGLHARGGVAIYDADDLIFDLDAFEWIDSPDFKDPVRARLYKEDMLRYRQTLDACDAVTVSTEFLAQEVRKLNKPVWIHRNGFSLEMQFYSEQARASRHKPGSAILIGYASGTPTHQKDLNLARPALEKLFAQFPQTALCLLGSIKLDPNWDSFQNRFGSRIQRLPRVSWRQLPFEIARWDINLAPLIMDNPFTQSKSEIKYMEAALVGVPTIASPTEAFNFAIHSGENGFLAANDDEWLKALEELIDGESRNRIGGLACQNVMDNYHAELRAKQLVNTLNAICHNNEKAPAAEVFVIPDFTTTIEVNENPEQNPLWINPNEEDHPTLLEMGLYNLRYRSLWTLIQQAWVFFRRLIAPLFPYR